MIPIVLITGPTGSGKTNRAIEYALKHNGEVISADSRQIYKGFPITTCKASVAEMQGVPHHLMSFLELDEVYSAAQFREDADLLIASIITKGKTPIIAGGTYFYLFALLFDQYLPDSPPNETFRASIAQQTTANLYAELQIKNPDRAQQIERNDRIRIVRALEIHNQLGCVPKLKPKLRYQVELITLPIERTEHRARLKQRIKSRLDGMLAEIKAGQDQLTPEVAGRLGFDFTLCQKHLNDLLSRDELIERLTAKDWQYSKRQLQWSGYLTKLLNP